jgi:hypothetical protein
MTPEPVRLFFSKCGGAKLTEEEKARVKEFFKDDDFFERLGWWKLCILLRIGAFISSFMSLFSKKEEK